MTHSYDKQLMYRAHVGRMLIKRGDDPTDVLAAVVWGDYDREEVTQRMLDDTQTGIIVRENPEQSETFTSLDRWGFWVGDDSRIGLYPKDGSDQLVIDEAPYLEFADAQVAMKFVDELKSKADQIRHMETAGQKRG